jgi:hypothetical protein
VTPVWLALPIIAIAAVLAWLCVWSRRDTWARPAAVALFIAAIPVVAYAGAETLSRAKPLSIAWELDADKYLVLGAKLVQDVGIWIYLDVGETEPRSYRLPWSNAMAQAIQDAIDGAPEGREGQFILQKGEQVGDMTAHPVPQPPAPPAKDVPEPGLVYEQG